LGDRSQGELRCGDDRLLLGRELPVVSMTVHDPKRGGAFWTAILEFPQEAPKH